MYSGILYLIAVWKGSQLDTFLMKTAPTEFLVSSSCHLDDFVKTTNTQKQSIDAVDINNPFILVSLQQVHTFKLA